MRGTEGTRGYRMRVSSTWLMGSGGNRVSSTSGSHAVRGAIKEWRLVQFITFRIQEDEAILLLGFYPARKKVCFLRLPVGGR